MLRRLDLNRGLSKVNHSLGLGRSEQGPEGLFSPFRVRDNFGRLFVRTGSFGRSGFEKGAVIRSDAVVDPGTVRFFALGGQTLIEVRAVFAAVNIASAIGTETVFYLHIQRKDRTTIVALPHMILLP